MDFCVYTVEPRYNKVPSGIVRYKRGLRYTEDSDNLRLFLRAPTLPRTSP